MVSRSDDDDYWNCDKCVEKGYIYTRNCKHPEYEQVVQNKIEQIPDKPKKAGKYSIREKLLKKRIKKGQKLEKKARHILPDDTRMDYCPLSDFDPAYFELVNLIIWSEDIKILPYSPNALMEQSNVYVEARKIVVGQRNKIQHLESKKKEDERKREADKAKSTKR